MKTLLGRGEDIIAAHRDSKRVPGRAVRGWGRPAGRWGWLSRGKSP